MKGREHATDGSLCLCLQPTGITLYWNSFFLTTNWRTFNFSLKQAWSDNHKFQIVDGVQLYTIMCCN